MPHRERRHIAAVSHEQVRNLLRRFEPLNPYGSDVANNDPSLGRSPWKVEHNSLDDPLWCYAIASKRYALYRRTATGSRIAALMDDVEEAGSDAEAAPVNEDFVADWSEHGLGMYLDPTDKQQQDKQGRRWIHDAWQWLLTTTLTNSEPPLPDWADRFAVSQFSVSSPQQANWFRLSGSPTADGSKPRPFGFGLLGHVDPFAASLVPARPAAPYARSPDTWLELSWYDRLTGQPIHTVNADQLGTRPEQLVGSFTTGAVPMRTIGDILRAHGARPPTVGAPRASSTRRDERHRRHRTSRQGPRGHRAHHPQLDQRRRDATRRSHDKIVNARNDSSSSGRVDNCRPRDRACGEIRLRPSGPT